MKLKSLIALVAIALLFGALAWHTIQQNKTAAAPAALGRKVLPNLAINRVAKLVITAPDGVTTVAKAQDKWVVASRFNYPAQFEKIADTIRELGELKIGQTVAAPPSRLEAFNLVAPVPGATNQPAGRGTLVELRDEKDGVLAALLIGKGFMRQPSQSGPQMMFGFGGYADGQYVQTMDGKVYLVAKNLERMLEATKTWLADDFINVPAGEIKEIEVTGPGRAPLKLSRAKDGDALVLADLRPEEGTLDSAKINQISGALGQLGFDDVADSALALTATGLDRPTVFKATAKDGLIYTLQIGQAPTNEAFDRYLTVSVTNPPAAALPPDKSVSAETDKPKDQAAPASKETMAGRAAALNAKFTPWIYIIKSYRAEPLLLKREDLIKKPEPPKTESEQKDSQKKKKTNK